ncbi:hypothetical protein ACI68E_002367 [Malassezia pachydermatis]
MTPTANGNERPEVLLLGFGGVGVIYSYILQKGGANVTAVCRSNYETVRENGIDIFSDKFDIVCCFKCVPDVKPNSEVMRPFLEMNKRNNPARLPMVVLIQNGVDIEEEAHQALVQASDPLASCIVSAVSWIAVTLLGQGTRIEHGLMESLTVGLYPSPLDNPVPAPLAESLRTFVTLAENGGGDILATNDIESKRWHKIMWNISWGGVCLMSRRPVQELLQAETMPYTLGVVRGIMLEMIGIVRASGIGEERVSVSLIDQVVGMTMSATRAKIRVRRSPDVFLERHTKSYARPDFKPSILVDLENGRPMELEPIFLNMIRRARRLGVDTPRLDLIAAAAKPIQLELVRKQRGEDHAALILDEEAIYDANPNENFTGCAPTLSS